MKKRTTFFCGIALFLLNILPAHSATLTHVRVGVHKDFTRIVFELNKQTLCEEPIEQSSGTCSIKLLNTKTTLNSTIPGQPKAKVKAIDLIKDEADLIAIIRLTYLKFEATSFILPNPYRIVLDIRPGEKSSEEKSERLKTADRSKVKAERLPTKEEKTLEEANINVQPLAVDTRLGNDTTQIPEDEEGSSENHGKFFVENEENKSRVYRIDTENEPSPAKDNKLQLYLLAVLVLSTLTLTLLCFLVLKRSRQPKKTAQQTVELDSKIDKTLDLIDEKINEKIDELCQNLRFKKP